ncbi:glycosyltransferase 87 family protein [Streptomyces sp. N2-109]|uniref:Glycosyltransferase 87 family protein n=1 Tax=Streptomyces gossypii TaxID=2883101 RepID=A0ABT2JRA0_9ACTN|nr:glycosyltransferase 87 family protein [Streptomyces gossypii]MCT2590408.1 glycosyltransferase 87 family protein [Streptomyces gossypii]
MRRPTATAALLCLLSFTGFWIAQRATDVSMIDLMVYRAQGWTVRSGEDLYSLRATHADLPATYPPFAALLFTPLTLLDVAEMRTAATVINLTLLTALIHLSLRLAGRPLSIPRPAATMALASLAVWCEPVWTTLRYGQVNLLLAVLVLWDLSRSPRHRWVGVGIGIAAGIKLTPALFAVFLALCGVVQGWRRLRRTKNADALWNPRLRQAVVATAAFLTTAVISAALLPRDSHQFWTDTLFTTQRIGSPESTANQSLTGVLARLLHTGQPDSAALVLTALAATVGLATAVAAALAGPRGLPHAPAWAALACAATALLISPFSWSHHWVWCVPMVLLVATEALRRGSPAWWCGAGVGALLFCSYALWWVPNSLPHSPRVELRQSLDQMLLSAVYPLAATLFLTVTATVSLRALLAGREPGARAKRTVPAREADQAVAKE